jgi:hypothetical protein
MNLIAFGGSGVREVLKDRRDFTKNSKIGASRHLNRPFYLLETFADTFPDKKIAIFAFNMSNFYINYKLNWKRVNYTFSVEQQL